MKVSNVLAVAAAAIGLSTVAYADGCGGSKSTTAATHQVATGDGMKQADGGKLVEKATNAAAPTIVQIAAGDPNFSTLVVALKQAGLVDVLSGKGPFTVFAPTNAAFAKVDPKALEALLKDKAALTRVLTYHVVSGNVLAADVTKLSFADTVSGQRATISTDKGVTIAGANVSKTDIVASNGVIHVIDSVMMPESKDIVGVATGAGQFKTLAKLLDAAGLVSTLQSEGPFTVFAPTDAAFAKLDKKLVDDLLKPENKAKLAGILTYHVVPGRVFSNQAVAAKTAKTVQGQNVTIEVKDGKAFVNDANLVKTDINASNGVIHVIDTVILPKN